MTPLLPVTSAPLVGHIAPPFIRLATGIDTTGALLDLGRNEQLWGLYSERKSPEGSPHREMSDLWLRYRAKAELDAGGPEAYLGPHIPVFYPAWAKLPAVHPIVWGLMAKLRAVQLGGVMLTTLAPGASIARHHDQGTWHSEFFNTKVYVVLQGDADCENECDGRTVRMLMGEAWTFNNLRPHSVVNRSADVRRITLIACFRVEE